MSRLIFDGQEAEVSPGPGGYAVRVGDREYSVRLLAWDEGLITFEVEGRVVSAAVEVRGRKAEVVIGGFMTAFPLEDGESAGAGAGAGGAGAGDFGPVRAELPGRVLEVRVSEGDSVEAGQVLLVAEAMKMEHAVRAAAPARVGRVYVEAGAQITEGEVLIELLPL
jgi:biotin carboxyl carrier protein